MYAMRAPLHTIIAVALLAWCCAAQAGERIVMSITMDPERTPTGRLMLLVYREALRQAGVDLEYHYYPPLRGTVLAKVGRTDGEIGRGVEYGPAHPELVRVEESATGITVAAFTMDPAITLRGWGDLHGTAYRVGYSTGHLLFKYRLEAALPESSLAVVNDTRQGLMNLALGQTKVYVDLYDDVAPLLVGDKYRYAGIHLAGVMEKPPLYAYLGKKYAHLAPRLAAILKAMRSDGTLARCQAEVDAAFGPAE